jgi:hypothetical protein
VQSSPSQAQQGSGCSAGTQRENRGNAPRQHHKADCHSVSELVRYAEQHHLGLAVGIRPRPNAFLCKPRSPNRASGGYAPCKNAARYTSFPPGLGDELYFLGPYAVFL